MTERYDAIVLGAGPAGSTAARHLARSGARVLLLDKAKFPRDKPCGGGITFRADEGERPRFLSSVTEREIYGVRISAAMGRRFDRTSPKLLARMTQRSKLDHFLAEARRLRGRRLPRRRTGAVGRNRRPGCARALERRRV